MPKGPNCLSPTRNEAIVHMQDVYSFRTSTGAPVVFRAINVFFTVPAAIEIRPKSCRAVSVWNIGDEGEESVVLGDAESGFASRTIPAKTNIPIPIPMSVFLFMN